MDKYIGKISNGLALLLTIMIFSFSSLNNYNVLIQILVGGALAFILSISTELILRFLFENVGTENSH